MAHGGNEGRALGGGQGGLGSVSCEDKRPSDTSVQGASLVEDKDPGTVSAPSIKLIKAIRAALEDQPHSKPR